MKKKPQNHLTHKYQILNKNIYFNHKITIISFSDEDEKKKCHTSSYVTWIHKFKKTKIKIYIKRSSQKRKNLSQS